MIFGYLPASKAEAMEPTALRTRNVSRAIILVALGVALSPFTSLPIGIARINPTQHFVNVLAAVMLGPWWAFGVAGIIAILRNALGTGTLLAFPGGMIGALLAGIFFRMTRNIYFGALGEILGTGLLGAGASALIVAPALMGKSMALGTLIIAFSGSSLLGAILGLAGLKLLERAGFAQVKIHRTSD
jgi:energy-coupling factor transport system ATP-binding protein